MPGLERPLGKTSEWSHAMTVHVKDQSYNLALAIWSLLEQNAASLKAEGASDKYENEIENRLPSCFRSRRVAGAHRER
jgi:hypothetical protein